MFVQLEKEALGHGVQTELALAAEARLLSVVIQNVVQHARIYTLMLSQPTTNVLH